MKSRIVSITSIAIVTVMLLSACSGIAALSQSVNPLSIIQAAQGSPTTSAPAATTAAQSSGSSSATGSQAQTVPTGSSDLLSAYQSTLESLYQAVNPSVVNITVMIPATSSSFQNLPGFGNNGNNNNNQAPQFSEALGSGFVWDTKGNIVTNNHVVDGATQVEVTFPDGTTVPAKIVGQDPYSDLAVINVSVSADKLHPVTMADSTQVKVGEIAIAIGNPYGFEGSMSTGIVSGIGRQLPSNVTDQTTGATYSIPDVIQTDASINPGNSGGVLIDDKGAVIGVTNSIESNSGSNSGVGFAIPSEIVSMVVPSLISTGKYDHPYLGISGTDMNPDIAQAMNLPADTRGALVVTVTAGGPAANAGLQPSNNTATISGQQENVGGDVITSINGQPVNSMSDIIAYLAIHTQVGQKVTLTILRNGQSQSVDVTLGSRPTQ